MDLDVSTEESVTDSSSHSQHVKEFSAAVISQLQTKFTVQQCVKQFTDTHGNEKQDVWEAAKRHLKDILKKIMKMTPPMGFEPYYITYDPLDQQTYCQKISLNEDEPQFGGRQVLYIANRIQNQFVIGQNVCCYLRGLTITQSSKIHWFQCQDIQNILLEDDSTVPISGEMEPQSYKVAHIKGPILGDVPVDSGVRSIVGWLKKMVVQEKITHLVITFPLFASLNVQEPELMKMKDLIQDTMDFIITQLEQLTKQCKVYLQPGLNDRFYSSLWLPQKFLVTITDDKRITLIENPQTLQIGHNLITFADLDFQKSMYMSQLLQQPQGLDSPHQHQKSATSPVIDMPEQARKSKIKIFSQTTPGSDSAQHTIKKEEEPIKSPSLIPRVYNSTTKILEVPWEMTKQSAQEQFNRKYQQFMMLSLVNRSLLDQLPCQRNYALQEKVDFACRIYSIAGHAAMGPIIVENENQGDTLVLLGPGIWADKNYCTISNVNGILTACLYKFELSSTPMTQ